MITVKDIETWRRKAEDEHLEFKEAKHRFDFELLVRYCCALANEGGGKIVLGMTDKLPRQVCGTTAFSDVLRTKAGVGERLRLRVNAIEVLHDQGRVLVFDVPPRPLGVPIEYKGGFWMRRGEELVGMTPDQLQRILAETVIDYSATILQEALFSDLDPKAIQRFRGLWLKKLGQREESKPLVARLKKLTDQQLLIDAELVVDGNVTVAAIVLMGKREAMGRLLANAETIFEYRNTRAAGPPQFRKEFREGFFLYYDELWELVNRWNTRQTFQEGFAILDIETFNERVVREATLNAISHRDYTHAGSVFLRVQGQEIEIDSPGGFPAGITAETLYKAQNPRNRRISEVFGRCGFVERSGQGVNLMIELAIQEGKDLPNYEGTDAYNVRLKLHGRVRDTEFCYSLDRYTRENETAFSTEELLVLDLVRRHKKVPHTLAPELKDMAAIGLIIGSSRGRGRKYKLSEKLLPTLSESPDEEPPNVLHREDAEFRILGLIEVSVAKGVSKAEIVSLFPSLSDGQIKAILRDLKNKGLIEARGYKKGSRWVKRVLDSKKE